MGTQDTYQQIDRPYDNLLQRDARDIANVNPESTIVTGPVSTNSQTNSTISGAPFESNSGTSGVSGSISGTGLNVKNGSVETQPVKNGGSIGDVWIDNFIRSINWKPKLQGFYIDGNTGYAEFTNVFISGEIEALTGLIGGFTIGPTDLSATDGVNTTILSSGDTAFQAGPVATPTVIITQDGQFTASRATITGSVTADSGAIGGFEITANRLFAGLAGTRISLSIVDGIHLGNNTFDDAPFSVSLAGELKAESGTIGGWTIKETQLRSANLVLDSFNQKIESTNYVSGINGRGFHLDQNLLEVGNISARGLIRTAVFQKDVVSTVGGNLAVLDGDVLNADMTADDAATLVIKGVTTFAVLDILRIKDGTNDEWLKVTNASNAPSYVVQRDMAGMYSSNNNPAWKKGATVVNYRQYGDGGVYMTASETNAPYMSIFDHAGDPWNSLNTRLRVGNLNGYLGYVSDTYGIAVGETDSYMKYDPVNGLSIQGNITVGTSNYIKGGQTDFATGTGFFLGYSGDYKFSIGNSTNYLTWDGTFMRLKGSFDVGAGGVINNASYTVATLPVAPTSLGYNNPSGID